MIITNFNLFIYLFNYLFIYLFIYGLFVCLRLLVYLFDF